MRDAETVEFLQWALPQLGMRWPGFRKVRKQVHKRLARRLVELGLPGLRAYRLHLRENPHEWPILDQMCRISISRFYRDRRVWDFVAGTLLPAMVGQAIHDGLDALRCWSIGCAGGEEPYTLRLVWDLVPDFCSCGLELVVVGTDADPRQLHRARQAIYSAGNLKDLPAGWRQRGFVETGDGWALRPEVRRGVEYLAQDFRQDFPPGRFDLILCRNLLFTYFASEQQSRHGQRILSRLSPGGALIVGKGERPPMSLGLRETAAHVGVWVL